MQNRYTADVGDFGKYALLNALAGTDLRLGVMWYFNSAEESNADGRFTAYANLKSCDQALYEKLSRILQNSARSLSEVEREEILPSGTLFYSEALPFPKRPCFSSAARQQQQESREEWFRRGYEELSTTDLVFLDPDNGAAGSRVMKHSRKSLKYVFPSEINDWLHRNQSVVVYQHQKRQALEGQVSEQLREFNQCGSQGWALSFHRHSARIYFVLPAPEHRALLWNRSNAFLASRWGEERHFRLHSGTHL